MKYNEKVLLAGFGGQGILAAGKIFAEACIDNDLYASWLPSYGPEMRGGTCNCQVVISDKEILSPVFIHPSYMLIMNQQSFDFFLDKMDSAKVIVINTSLVDVPEHFAESHADIKCVSIPATATAIQLGNVKCANMVMLGALAKNCEFLQLDTLEKCIRTGFKGKENLIDLNVKAAGSGYSNAELFY